MARNYREGLPDLPWLCGVLIVLADRFRENARHRPNARTCDLAAEKRWQQIARRSARSL